MATLPGGVWVFFLCFGDRHGVRCGRRDSILARRPRGSLDTVRLFVRLRTAGS